MTKRVAVIGAGPSGLVSIKAALEQDFEVVCFESSKCIGGLWNYDQRKGSTSIYDSVISNTSKHMMQFSDFPVPKDWPRFLPHKKVLEYLELYAENFDLKKHIKFSRPVESVQQEVTDGKETSRWEIVYRSWKTDRINGSKVSLDIGVVPGVQYEPSLRPKSSITFNFKKPALDSLKSENRVPTLKKAVFDFVLICTGHHWKPNMPDFPGMDEFQGHIIHSQQYNVPYPYKDDRVLVIGVGNSGIDIATEMTAHASKLVLSSRSGNWVVPKTAFFGLPTDHLSTRVANSLPSSLTNFALEGLLKIHQGDLASFKLKPKHRINEAPAVVGTQILQYIDSGKVTVKPNVAKFIGDKLIEFEDGTIEEFDTIICCTGYKIENSFIDERLSETISKGKVKLYRHIFPTDCDSVGFIGLVHSTISNLPVSEMQARWACSAFSGKVPIPNFEERAKQTELAYNEHLKRFGKKDRNAIVVDHIEYQDMLALDIRCKPDLYRLWKGNWGSAMRLTFGPVLAAQYRLYGPHKWDGAEAEILEACSHFDINAIFSSFLKGAS